MTKIVTVPAEEIESIVGVLRHDHDHIGRVSENHLGSRTVHILHSQECVSQNDDLRECEFSKALAWLSPWEWPINCPLYLDLIDRKLTYQYME